MDVEYIVYILITFLIKSHLGEIDYVFKTSSFGDLIKIKLNKIRFFLAFKIIQRLSYARIEWKTPVNFVATNELHLVLYLTVTIGHCRCVEGDRTLCNINS